MRAKARYFRANRAFRQGGNALAGNREYDPQRFEDLVLFIAWTMRDDPHFGRTKLAKTLFYVDFDAYAEEGESLTGSTYEHWEHGPFPPQLYDVERKLVFEGRAGVKEPEGPGDEARLIPTREPIPRTPFEDWVKVFVARRANDLAEEPSWRVEDASHRHRGWELTKDREEIPYSTHFIPRVRSRPPDKAFEIGRRVIRDFERS
jgi:hypothetical protein